MGKLNEAQEVLKTIHEQNDKTQPVIISSFPGWTVMISPNTFGDEYPMTEIIRNEDLLKVYGYAEDCFNGDPAFDEYEGTIMEIDGMDDISQPFIDLFYSLVKIDQSGVCKVMDFEKFMSKPKQTLKLV